MKLQTLAAIHTQPTGGGIALAVTLAATLAVLAGCGGGGTSSSNPTPPTTVSGVYAAGPIRGFGSVIVNGVRLDVSAATISDDEGDVLSESQLRLGMQIEAQGAAGKDDAHGVAQKIHVHSALIGSVTAIDLIGGTLTVLGQTVTTSPQTTFDTGLANGLTSLTAGAIVKVYAQFDTASNSYVATRIDLDATAPYFKINGAVTSLDTTNKTLAIGPTLVSFATTVDVPTDLAVGKRVDVHLATTAVNGMWSAISIDHDQQLSDDHDAAHIEGVVSAFTSASQFSLGGTPVDASNATFPDGQAGVVLGASVEVEGQMVNGTLVAKVVQAKNEQQHDDLHVELHGAISALDTTAKTFVVRGVTVSYAGTVTFENGTVAALANGLFVEVVGGISANGTSVDATRINLQPAD